MTEYSEALELEHRGSQLRLDIRNLTVVADTLDRMFAQLRGGPSHDMQDSRVVPAGRHRASIMGDGPDGFYHLCWT
jgi:hypothetical protein